ncbi:putative ENTH domain containing protein [Blattamonas nauphoetae]|uniref:ENTH domain containing protein n=1 Tax=Blattamonas nauphoetae TaxID=2049346 RepID=A0ABQ9XFJ0_9EUKA|nr:putative ENTH domain containing protein [Blattamonas nauphoetae]
MVTMWTRLEQKPRDWKIVYKALGLAEALIRSGDIRCVDMMKANVDRFRRLNHFQYINTKQVDCGVNVREKSKTIVAILEDDTEIKTMRQDARRLAERMQGVSSSRSTSNRHAPDYNSEPSYQPSPMRPTREQDDTQQREQERKRELELKEMEERKRREEEERLAEEARKAEEERQQQELQRLEEEARFRRSQEQQALAFSQLSQPPTASNNPFPSNDIFFQSNPPQNTQQPQFDNSFFMSPQPAPVQQNSVPYYSQPPQQPQSNNPFFSPEQQLSYSQPSSVPQSAPLNQSSNTVYAQQQPQQQPSPPLYSSQPTTQPQPVQNQPQPQKGGLNPVFAAFMESSQSQAQPQFTETKNEGFDASMIDLDNLNSQKSAEQGSQRKGAFLSINTQTVSPQQYQMQYQYQNQPQQQQYNW